jgi:glycogen(starch) synthase
MRIALATSSYLPNIGGVEEHVLHVGRELQARGHDVSVWTVRQPGSPPPADDGLPVRDLPCPLPNRSAGGMARWVAAAPRAWNAWAAAGRADQPDIIDIQCFGPNGPYATALARRRRTPLVYSNHGETFMDAHGAFENSALLRRSLRDTLGRAAATTSCSAFAATDLKRFAAIQTPVIVGNGIDLGLEPSRQHSQLPRTYIAGIGRLVANKGFDVLVRAFAQASPHLVDTDLVIAGTGPEADGLSELARHLGVEARVHLIGGLDRASVRTVLDGALLHIVPSRVEAFGIVVLEGWRSGAPVLCTNIGGPPEFVTDNVDGLLFNPEDAPVLAHLIIKVVDDWPLRARLAQAGREAAKRYSWSAVADRYEAAFESAIITTTRIKS